jgi:hypothetical protein
MDGGKKNFGSPACERLGRVLSSIEWRERYRIALSDRSPGRDVHQSGRLAALLFPAAVD